MLLGDLLGRCRTRVFIVDWIHQSRRNSEIMTIPKIRSLFYFVARTLGDVSAVKKGTVGKWVLRRGAGMATGQFVRKLIK
jgi:hypothetical protein